eukprot:gnl/Carplike_NY0171/16397_a24831_67.p1 GENE.gnl/Carplike_NY0171/16397_a24831_67~~gnl/Carplike_NY0171/16397_a24831_67.p1  ORF type:complete len:236 (+),score=38.24 gnl/Carplike_NY0171/16397_a24831_67:82-789(+)
MFHTIQCTGDMITMLVVFEGWLEQGKNAAWCQDVFVNHQALYEAHKIRLQLLEILDRFEIYKAPVYLQVDLEKGRKENYKYEEYEPADTLTIKSSWSRGQCMLSIPERRKLLKCILGGFFTHIAVKEPGEGYKTLNEGNIVYIHPSSSLADASPHFVVYHELVVTSREYMRNVSVIRADWVEEMAPRYARICEEGEDTVRARSEKLTSMYNPRLKNQEDWRLSRQLKTIKRLKRK